MKKIAVTTWCTDDYIDYIGLDELRNSFKHLKNPGYYIIEDVHRKPSNIKKFNNFFLNEKIKYEIIDIPHKNNIHDNCLILIRKD